MSDISKLIDDYCGSFKEDHRPHLGCSLAGYDCDRFIWLSFRWALSTKKEGRIVRLLKRGNEEERKVLALLKNVGCQIKEKAFGEQDSVSFGCHISGSADGIIYSGVPEAPNEPHVLEIKTHNKKSFEALVKDGVKQSKYQHYIQVQLYMLGLNIQKALYFAVCKDDDRIYTENIDFDKELAEKTLLRMKDIALSPRPPEKISYDPTWWKCKMCSAHDLCHGSKLTTERNCRTCAHSTATEDSKWRCDLYKSNNIKTENQRKGCRDSHVLHPDLVPWQMKPTENGRAAIYIINGVEVLNGEGGSESMSLITSAETIANPPKLVEKIIDKFSSLGPHITKVEKYE